MAGPCAESACVGGARLKEGREGEAAYWCVGRGAAALQAPHTQQHPKPGHPARPSRVRGVHAQHAAAHLAEELLARDAHVARRLHRRLERLLVRDAVAAHVRGRHAALPQQRVNERLRADDQHQAHAQACGGEAGRGGAGWGGVCVGGLCSGTGMGAVGCAWLPGAWWCAQRAGWRANRTVQLRDVAHGRSQQRLVLRHLPRCSACVWEGPVRACARCCAGAAPRSCGHMHVALPPHAAATRCLLPPPPPSGPPLTFPGMTMTNVRLRWPAM